VTEGLTKREEDPQLTVVRSASCIEGSLHSVRMQRRRRQDPKHL